VKLTVFGRNGRPGPYYLRKRASYFKPKTKLRTLKMYSGTTCRTPFGCFLPSVFLVIWLLFCSKIKMASWWVNSYPKNVGLIRFRLFSFIQLSSRTRFSLTMWPEGFEDPVEHKSMFPALQNTDGTFSINGVALFECVRSEIL
jgi:hypothetical protein